MNSSSRPRVLHGPRRRGLVIGSMVCLVSVLVGMTWLWQSRLPEPADCSTTQLVMWMLRVDLSQHPRDTHVALVDRLEEKFVGRSADDISSGPLAKLTKMGANSHWTQRLSSNVEILQPVWFQDRVRQYQQCAADARLPFMLKQIEVVKLWSSISSFSVSSDSESAKSSPLFSHIDRWLDQASPAELPAMNEAIKDGLICWLATTDLAEQPQAVRDELSRRIAKSLDKNPATASATSHLPFDDSQQQRLASNGLLLVECWYRDQANVLGSMQPAARSAFVDARIAQVQQWSVLQHLWKTANSEQGTPGDKSRSARVQPSNSSLALAGQLLPQVQLWIARAPSEEQAQMKLLLQTIQQRLLWRQLQKWSQ